MPRDSTHSTAANSTGTAEENIRMLGLDSPRDWSSIFSKGECEFCLRGDAQICPTQTQPGVTGFGSFAEYVAIENADFNVISIPAGVSFSVASALGCRFATAYRGLVKRAKVEAGEKVIIYGCGGVGLSAVMIAKALGAKVYAVDVSVGALELAASLGAIPILLYSRIFTSSNFVTCENQFLLQLSIYVLS
jgi:D-arabinose 1-dehydrogenase-like Zn-dependent alcohol dehydrogenase